VIGLRIGARPIPQIKAYFIVVRVVSRAAFAFSFGALGEASRSSRLKAKRASEGW
jgi:hypothetical protein